MRRNKRLLVLVTVLVAAIPPTAVTASSNRTAGALAMNASLALIHGAEDPSSDCPGDECAARRAFGPFPGLGQVEIRYDVAGAFGPPACAAFDARLLANAFRLTVAGKGEIHVALAEGPCVPVTDVINQSQTFIVTGGTGSYAGASGGGVVARSLGELGAQGRSGRETWTGTLQVAGLEFDLTPPVLTGATKKTVKAKKGAKRARVTFRVTAQDDRDGAVPVACSPRSGFAFPVGRTRVTCDASDSSANVVKASFTVVVQRGP
jgi:hypothetical protein